MLLGRRDLDTYIIAKHLDIRTVIRLSWTNRHLRALAQRKIAEFMAILDPWIYNGKHRPVPLLWHMSRRVYLPVSPFMFAFHANVDKRKGVVERYTVDPWNNTTCYRFGTTAPTLRALGPLLAGSDCFQTRFARKWPSALNTRLSSLRCGWRAGRKQYE